MSDNNNVSTKKQDINDDNQQYSSEVKYISLNEVSNLEGSKISISKIKLEDYISTENMVSDLGRVKLATNMPNNGNINIYKKGDILISNIRPYLKKIWYATKNGGCSSDVLILRPNSKIYPKYLFYVLSSNKFFNYMMKTSKGTKMPRGDKKSIMRFKVPFIEMKKQKKYTFLLSRIDNKIDLLEKKKEIKLKIKEYYIQQIFLEDWDNKIKFYDYKPLNEITFYQEGPGVRNYQYTNKGVKLLNVGNFVKNKLILENTDRYISKEEAYGKYKHFLVDEGDLLIACSGIKAEYFNEKIAFAEKKDLPLCMNTSTMRFKSLDDNYLNLNYLKWYFQTPLFKKEIFRILTGSAQFNFGPTHLKYLKILIPPLDYQIKIGNFMDLIKENIDYIDIKIKLMKQFKKGLLQKMFV